MKKLDYERLASLPLFIGIDGATLLGIYETINPVIAPMRKGNILVSDGEECRALVFLLEGELKATTVFGSGKFTLDETLRPVSILEPQCLFGLHTIYTRTYTALGSGHYLRLPKNIVVGQMFQNEVFRFNFVNMLSSQVQQTASLLRSMTSSSIESRITAIFQRQLLRPVGHKTVRCKMTDLAYYVGETRLNISRALHSLEQRQLLTVSRGVIDIPAFEKLLAAVN